MEAVVEREPVAGGETTIATEQQQQPLDTNNKEPAQINSNGEQEQLKPESHHETTTTSSVINTRDDANTIEVARQTTKADEEAREKELLLSSKAGQDQIDDNDFVIVDPDSSFRVEKHKASFFAQMDKYLVDQVALCNYYKKLYEEQKNATLANLFSTHLLNSTRDLDLLRIAMTNNESLPKYKLETVNFNGVPISIDVKEKELQLVIRTTKMPVSSHDAQLYVIGEFSFAPSDQPMSSTISRWFHHVKVEPKNLICCSVDASRQLDIVHSTDRKPFTNPASEWLEYDRPMLFTVNKGRSRTHKRKFKPIKLTFFERTTLLKCDKKLGTVQLKVDAINDEARIITKQVILNGRKDTGAFADIQIKVLKPLVENTIRAYEEKLLILS